MNISLNPYLAAGSSNLKRVILSTLPSNNSILMLDIGVPLSQPKCHHKSPVTLTKELKTHLVESL